MQKFENNNLKCFIFCVAIPLFSEALLKIQFGISHAGACVREGKALTVNKSTVRTKKKLLSRKHRCFTSWVTIIFPPHQILQYLKILYDKALA